MPVDTVKLRMVPIRCEGHPPVMIISAHHVLEIEQIRRNLFHLLVLGLVFLDCLLLLALTLTLAENHSKRVSSLSLGLGFHYTTNSIKWVSFCQICHF